MSKLPTLTKNGIIPPFDAEFCDSPTVAFDSTPEAVEPAGADSATFTVFMPKNGTPVGKSIGADGTKTNHRFPAQMLASRTTLNLTQLAASIRAGCFLTSGIFDVPVALVTPHRMPEPNGSQWPIRHRGKTDMKRPEGAGLMFVDNDFATVKGNTMRLLVSVAPVLDTCARLVKASSGSNIYGAADDVLRGMQGEHAVFVCADANDTEHNLRVLHKLLMIAGRDNCNVTKSGRFNERTAVDLQLRHPWQPVFLAATLADGCTQDLDIEVTQGALLGRLSDLTPDQEAAYLTARAARHDELIPLMEKTRGEWIDERVAEGWSRASAVRALATGELERDAKIMLADGSVVTVTEIIAAPDKYNHAITCDPLEPDYRGFADVGIIYMDGPRPMIFSQAHGGMKFWLPRTSAADDFADGGDSDFPQDHGPAASDAEPELPPIEPWSADPEALKWASVQAVEVGSEFKLGDAELAAGVALAGGLALADGRLVRLTNTGPAVRLLTSARESGDVGAVAKDMSERIIPALGSAPAITFAADQFRMLTDLGGNKAKIKEAVTDLCRTHAGRIAAFAKKMRPALGADGAEDPAEVAARRRAERLAAEAAAAEARAVWLKSFAHITADPFGELRKALAAAGLAGDTTGGEVAYMTITSAAFPEGVERANTSLRGATGVGKSAALKAALALCPVESYHEMNGGSATSLFYKRGENDVEGEEGTFFRNRCIILPEADALLHDAKEGDGFQCSVKSILSEQRLAREVTIPGAPGSLPTVETVRQAGPTNLLTSSTHSFEAQMENRVFGFEVNQSPENERIVKAAIANQYEGGGGSDFNPDPWKAYGLWLREETPTVVLPFSSALAALHSTEHGFRNFHLLHAVASTAALMNKANREKDAKGRIIATIDDYGVAHRLMAGPSDSKIGAAIDRHAIPVFRKIEALIQSDGVSCAFGEKDAEPGKRLTINQRNLAKVLGMPRSTFQRQFNYLKSVGLVLEDRPDNPSKPLTIWVAKDAEEILKGDAKQRLPTPSELEAQMSLTGSFCAAR